MQAKKLATLFVVVMLLIGCAALAPQLPQTPRDKSDLFMSYYMAQLKDYNDRYIAVQQYGDDMAFEMERKILEAKFWFLQAAWEPIAMYDGFVTNGEIPPQTLEQHINSLIEMLEQKLREDRK